jgi:putative ABC transport system permease protein
MGTGADIIIRPPDSAGFTFSLTMPEKIVEVVRAKPHVRIATGTFVKYIDSFNSITGIHLDDFNEMSGGLKVKKGRMFQGPDDIVVDEIFAKQRHVQPGGTVDLGYTWNVSGIVEQGKLSRTFADITSLQKHFAGTGFVSTIYVKLDDPANTRAVISDLQKDLPAYKVDSIEDFVSLFSTNSVPYIESFTKVVIGVAVLIGFLVVCLSMYTAVLERTREIGILKALGASPAYIVGILLRETIMLALAGTVVGILMTYGTRALMAAFAPSMAQEIVPDWYLRVTGIALAGAIVGALYPGLRAARQDAIEALAYD